MCSFHQSKYSRDSLLGTCKINNVEPYSWLKNTLNPIPDQSIHKLDELLPK
ncbi:MAG: transposase domain-containing protein [Bacteroidales bacterium]|nr:transposase domain-containing protein [Bacteroidales bacterium]